MAAVEIFVTSWCPYCHAALDLLSRRGVVHTTVDVTNNPEARRSLAERAEGRTTVPQIFLDGRPIGGFDELTELDASGELDSWQPAL